MAKATREQRTFLDELQTSLAACLRCPEGVAPPVAILWTDTDGQWRPLAETLRNTLPHFYTLGAYDPAQRTGPVIWLKCIVERTLPEAPPVEVVPILYLPGVDRQQLRNAHDCPTAWQPLAELQYRGTVWMQQKNGRDWSVDMFLSSPHGLGLDVATNAATKEAMLRALPTLANELVQPLRGRRLDADAFNQLLVSDTIRETLQWLNDPDGFRHRHDANHWKTFCQVASSKFGMDPEKGVEAFAQALVAGEDECDVLWQRFAEAPSAYRGLGTLLQALPEMLYIAAERNAKANAEEEDKLRADLDTLTTLPHHQACERLVVLESQHAVRRGWVWAKLDASPLAVTLEPLAALARYAKTPLGGATLATVIKGYTEGGWHADRAALDALTSVEAPADRSLVEHVVRALYVPWLDQSARHFQTLVGAHGEHLHRLTTGLTAEKETCLLFADGLRYDVAQRVLERLEANGVRGQRSHRIAPLPTVTATAKPLATPVHSALQGDNIGADFTPLVTATQQPATAPRLRDLMQQAGVVVLSDDLRPTGNLDHGAWHEAGQLDSLGHKIGLRLAHEIAHEVEVLVERVIELLDAGWPRVRIVTDHGWLLVPGGMPKVELAKYLTATKWARCAVVQGESATTLPTVGWHWNPLVRIATPPGLGAFTANAEYAHGGLSVQECVVPELLVERGAPKARATIKGIQWRGMRCRVQVETNAPGAKVDLRRNWKQATTSIAANVKDLSANGDANVAVSDDSHEGSAAAIVVLTADGQVLAHEATTVGEGT